MELILLKIGLMKLILISLTLTLFVVMLQICHMTLICLT